MPLKLLLLVLSYILGSVPFPYLMTRLKTGKDIREIGSGNVGATNVMRTTGKLAGFFTLLLDAGKGAIAVYLGRRFGTDAWGAACGFTCALGHSYPLFLGFRGGKSVATGAGAFLMLSPAGILISGALFLILLASFRIVSLASVFASGFFPLFALVLGVKWNIVIWGAMTAALIIYRHGPNLARLVQGTEKRLGEKKNV